MRSHPSPPQALLAYIRSGLEEGAYWAALTEGGVTAARLASYDRAITEAPRFSKGARPGGTRPGVC